MANRVDYIIFQLNHFEPIEYKINAMALTFLSPPPGMYASFLAAIRDETLNSSFLFSILILPPPGLCAVLLNDPIFDRTSRRFGGGALPTRTLFIDTSENNTRTKLARSIQDDQLITLMSGTIYDEKRFAHLSSVARPVSPKAWPVKAMNCADSSCPGSCATMHD